MVDVKKSAKTPGQSSFSFFSSKTKIDDAAVAETTREKVSRLSEVIDTAINLNDFETFSRNMSELQAIAAAGPGNLPAFRKYFETCRLIHQGTFDLILGEFIEPDAEAIFNKNPSLMRSIAAMTIKDWQFSAFQRRQPTVTATIATATNSDNAADEEGLDIKAPSI